MKKTILAGLCLALLGCGGTTQTEPTTYTQSEPAPEPAPAEPAIAEDPSDVHIEGDHLVIDGHINFESDSDVIMSDSTELLDHIAQMLSNHGDEIQHLKIIGHTDAAGGHDHNQELSDRRAAAVEQALRDRGVQIELEHSGVGETEPLCQADSDECHAQNRRVEFLIVADAAE